MSPVTFLNQKKNENIINLAKEKFQDRRLGQAYRNEINYDTSNNSLNVIINKSKAENKVNGVAHLLKTVGTIKFNINPDLSIEQKEKLHTLLARHIDCFASGPMDLGAIDIGDVPIPTVSNDPVSLPPFRLSLSSKKELQRQVDEFLEAGLIVSSNSAYASPAFLVDKTDGSKRMVIEYRAINKLIPHQNFPIPHIQTIFDCLEGSVFFNVMDMQNGFLNILLGKNDRHNLAFITSFGLYEWTRYPFGYKNSPRQFSKAVAENLSGLLDTIKWTNEHQSVFEDFKIKLTSPPLLRNFNPKLNIIIWTDASKIGIAGTLLQEDYEDETLLPVAYVSRRISSTEENYSAIELELLAIVYVVEQFRMYTYGKYIEIWTDHAPLRYLENIKSFSTRIQRLKNKLVDYDYVIKYRKGLLNQVCDAMSRYPVEISSSVNEQVVGESMLSVAQIRQVNMQILQANDTFLSNIIQSISNPELTSHVWVRKSKNYFFNKEKVLLYKGSIKNASRDVVVLPKVLVRDTLLNFHDHPFSTHLGVEKTYKKISERYYWPGMYKEIKSM
ncbi:Uncharacterized protein FWK35_00034789, partial [Aphis craccivora]